MFGGLAKPTRSARPWPLWQRLRVGKWDASRGPAHARPRSFLPGRDRFAVSPSGFFSPSHTKENRVEHKNVSNLGPMNSSVTRSCHYVEPSYCYMLPLTTFEIFLETIPFDTLRRSIGRRWPSEALGFPLRLSCWNASPAPRAAGSESNEEVCKEDPLGRFRDSLKTKVTII